MSQQRPDSVTGAEPGSQAWQRLIQATEQAAAALNPSEIEIARGRRELLSALRSQKRHVA